MALFLTEADVEEALDMRLAISAVEEAFRLLGGGKAINQPRRRVITKRSVLHVMAAGAPDLGSAGEGALGVKVYGSSRLGVKFLVLLYGAEEGRLLALLQGDRLGQLRTGAATGVAARYLSREDASRVGIIGTGWQARGQLTALAAVRRLKGVRAYGRDAGRRLAFCREMEGSLGVPVEPAERAEAAVQDADLLVTVTTAKDPVLLGEWLRPGMHVSAVGSNWAERRELDTTAVRFCDRIVVDSLEQAKMEAGDLITPVHEGALTWDRVEELGPIVAGEKPGRRFPEEITLFMSQGLALEDVAVARRAYDRAREKGLGRELDL